jgi:hypothetical protein
VPEPLAALGGTAPGTAARARATAHASEDALVTGHSEDGLVWAIGDGETLLLANLSTRPRRVRLPGRTAPLDLEPTSWSAAPAV